MSFVAIAQEFFKAVALDLDEFTEQKAQITVNDYKSVSLDVVKHIQFAKYGRGPGKNPPLNPILEWVKRKRVQFRDLKGRFATYRGTAFAIMKSIAKKGTKNWKPNAPNAMEEAINNNILDYYKRLSDFTIDTQYKELQKIYENNIPRKITIKI